MRLFWNNPSIDTFHLLFEVPPIPFEAIGLKASRVHAIFNGIAGSLGSRLCMDIFTNLRTAQCFFLSSIFLDGVVRQERFQQARSGSSFIVVDPMNAMILNNTKIDTFHLPLKFRQSL
jgi:hypothetical protein